MDEKERALRFYLTLFNAAALQDVLRLELRCAFCGRIMLSNHPACAVIMAQDLPECRL